MLFNSLQYLLFFPIVFTLYWLLGYTIHDTAKQIRWQNLFLLLASYIFYAWWDWRFLSLLIGMSLISWLAGDFLANNFTRGGVGRLRANLFYGLPFSLTSLLLASSSTTTSS